MLKTLKTTCSSQQEMHKSKPYQTDPRLEMLHHTFIKTTAYWPTTWLDMYVWVLSISALSCLIVSHLYSLPQFLSMIILTETCLKGMRMIDSGRERLTVLLCSPGYWLLSMSESPRRVNPNPAGMADEAQAPLSTWDSFSIRPVFCPL